MNTWDITLTDSEITDYDDPFSEEIEKRREYHNRWYSKNRRYDDSSKSKSQKYDSTKYKSRTHDKPLRPFVAWDGEGTTDTGYSLFGNSEGYEICAPGLSSKECLELIIECETDMPEAIHVGFAFTYDVNWILKDMPWPALLMLHKTNRVFWGDYDIEYIPHKWFKVKKDGVIAKIFDVFSFFNSSYMTALNEYKIGDVEIRATIQEGKDKRAEFSWAEIKFIRKYWEAEISLMPPLMDYLRTVFYDAGFRIQSWHGPGSLARFALKQHNIQNYMAETPIEVWLASRYAYSGGHFEQFLAGYYEGEITNVDINSAYPYAISLLPNLASGYWERKNGSDIESVDPKQFALYRIRFRNNGASKEPFPLFRRYRDGNIRWPQMVESWYWSPEAALVYGDKRAEFMECWIFHDDNSRPFYWVNDYYKKRLWLKSQGNPIQLAFKLALNAIYGQLAMRAGWERYKGKPPYHQLEWAGYVTSMCKAMVYKAAIYAYERKALISIDTDGIYATCRIPDYVLGNGTGDNLGQWEVETYDGIIAWQSGFYWLKKDGEWKKAKTRGIPKGTVDVEYAFQALANLNEDGSNFAPIKKIKKTFVGFGQALSNQFGKWLTWRETEFYVEFAGNDGKRKHNPLGCSKCRGYAIDLSPGLHETVPNTSVVLGDSGLSYMHYLPWAENDSEDHRPPNEFVEDIVWDDDIG